MKKKVLLLALAAAALTACGTMPEVGGGSVAIAELQPTKGNTTRGVIVFTPRGNRVEVSGNVYGMKPGFEHGFHVHEKGDCSSGDGMSAGGHFNPTGQPHGSYPDGSARHAGDMPNLRADSEGIASTNFDMTGITIGSGNADIIGKAVIVHRDPDDYKSQPAGNSGARIACGVIAAA